MNNNELMIFYYQIGLILTAALVFGQLVQKIGQPAVFGELLGGIFIGPTVLKTLFPSFFGYIFPGKTAISPELNCFIQLGMLLFMFVAGLEVNFTFALRKKKCIFLTSLLGIIIPLALGTSVVFLFPWIYSESVKSNTLIFALFIGTALSISALPVILKTLIDLKLIKTEIGIVIMSSATINDLAGWTLFATIIEILMTKNIVGATIAIFIAKIVGLSAFIFVFSSKVGIVFTKWMRKFFTGPSVFIGITIVFILVVAGIAESLGIHPFFMVFLLGIAVRKYFRIKEMYVYNVIYKFAMSFFAPLYFITIGLKADFISNFDFTLVLTIILVACSGKIIGASLGAYLGGMDIKHALCVGFGMNSRGAVEIIIASTALDLKLIDDRVYIALVIMAIFTSMLSGPAIRAILAKENKQMNLVGNEIQI